MVNSTQKRYVSIIFFIFNLIQLIFGQQQQQAAQSDSIVQLGQPGGYNYGGGGGFNQYPQYPPGGGYPGNNNYGVSQFPVISCPNLFSYQHDASLGGYYGLIVTPKSKYDTEFVTEVNMTINRAVAQSDNIKLNILSTQDEIFHGDVLKWSIKFPYQDVLPKLTQIKFNGMVICSNQPDPLVSGITQTSMWAQATIRLSAGGDPQPNSGNPGGQMLPPQGGGYPGPMGQQPGLPPPPPPPGLQQYQPPPYYPPSSQPGGLIIQNGGNPGGFRSNDEGGINL